MAAAEPLTEGVKLLACGTRVVAAHLRGSWNPFDSLSRPLGRLRIWWGAFSV